MNKFIFIIILFFLFQSCSKKTEEISTVIEGESLEEQMIQAYNAELRL